MTTPTQKSSNLLARLFALFSSFGLATSVLILLLFVTYVGTLEQVEHGLYESQKKYFESLFIWSIDLGACLRAMSINSTFGHVPVLLPGGFLLMTVLGLNMVCGAVIRMRKGWRTAGVLIAHLSIIFMILAGAIEFFFKKDGNMPLFEGQSSDEFQSYHERVIEIEQVDPPFADGKRLSLVIPQNHFLDLAPDGTTGKARTFSHASLPFDLVLRNYQENCEPKRADGSESREVVDGYYLQPKTPNPTAEQNIDGIYATVKDKNGGAAQDGILWGISAAVSTQPLPWTVKVEGKTYAIDIGRQRWKLPFAVRLDKFERELHPGTERARKFTSFITKLVDKHEEKKIITMNEPLRDQGFVLFQASFNMEQRGSGAVKQSVFAVVENPTDHWPLYACVAAGIGLGLHFFMMLGRFVGRQRKTANA